MIAVSVTAAPRTGLRGTGLRGTGLPGIGLLRIELPGTGLLGTERDERTTLRQPYVTREMPGLGVTESGVVVTGRDGSSKGTGLRPGSALEWQRWPGASRPTAGARTYESARLGGRARSWRVEFRGHEGFSMKEKEQE
jgi:hypothetical protein